MRYFLILIAASFMLGCDKKIHEAKGPISPVHTPVNARPVCAI
jgi:hypothetical protein